MTTRAGLDGAEIDVDQLIGLRHRGATLTFSPQRAKQNLSGPSQSLVRGLGMEYAESRTYLPGDDIRHIDWRVTARTGRAHTKLYQEERERPVILLVDLGPSMFFGTRRAFKSVAAAEAAGLLAWAALANGDRVGGVVAGTNIRHALNPTAGRRGVLRLLGAIAECAKLGSQPGRPGPSVFDDACRRLRQITRPGSLVFVISDHYDFSDETLAHLRKTRTTGDLTGLWIHDPIESAPPPAGRYPVTDGIRRANIDSSLESIRTAYSLHFAQRREAVRQLYAEQRAPLVELSTADDVETGLRRALLSGYRDSGNDDQH